MRNGAMTFRKYPIIITHPGDFYRAICPDLPLEIEIHGFDSIAEVCGGAMANVQMYCNEMIIAGIRLPPATQITEVNSIVLNKNTMTLSNFNPADTLKVTAL